MRRFVGFIIIAAVSACASSPQQASTAPVDSGPLTGIAVGNLAPDFTLTDSDGRTTRLADFRGKVVLLEFSAMW